MKRTILFCAIIAAAMATAIAQPRVAVDFQWQRITAAKAETT